MIRIVSFEPLDDVFRKEVLKHVFKAFGEGTEYRGEMPMPSGLKSPLSAGELLNKAPALQALREDRVVYLTDKPFSLRKTPGGDIPTHGASEYGGTKIVFSTGALKKLETPQAMRFLLQEIGHTFGLYHCVDPRCSMYPSWVPSYAAGQPTFCSYCRDYLDRKTSDYR